MLVLTRKIGEELVIAGHIRVAVVDVQQRKVRIGIVAPPSVRVLRKEILSKNAAAAGTIDQGEALVPAPGSSSASDPSLRQEG